MRKLILIGLLLLNYKGFCQIRDSNRLGYATEDKAGSNITIPSGTTIDKLTYEIDFMQARFRSDSIKQQNPDVYRYQLVFANKGEVLDVIYEKKLPKVGDKITIMNINKEMAIETRKIKSIDPQYQKTKHKIVHVPVYLGEVVEP